VKSEKLEIKSEKCIKRGKKNRSMLNSKKKRSVKIFKKIEKEEKMSKSPKKHKWTTKNSFQFRISQSIPFYPTHLITQKKS